MKRTIRFGLDLDGVVFDWVGGAHALLNSHFGYSLPATSAYWDFTEEHVTPDHWKWLWKDGVEKYGLFRNLYPMRGALEFIDWLDKRADIVIMTQRPKVAEIDTLMSLCQYRIFPKSVHFFHGSDDPKSDVKCDIYLDDKPSNCEDLDKNTSGRVFLNDQPHNWSYTPPHTTAINRVYDFESMRKWFRAIKTIKKEGK
jgi:5'(3')-deoxyribonucleotidase